MSRKAEMTKPEETKPEETTSTLAEFVIPRAEFNHGRAPKHFAKRKALADLDHFLLYQGPVEGDIVIVVTVRP